MTAATLPGVPLTAPGYAAPETLADAHALLVTEGPDARVFAGGTDLLVQLRHRLTAPRLLVDLKRLGLREIAAGPQELRIGALATHAEIAADAMVRERFPALAAACRSVGGPPTRNRGTLGGNLVNASPAADAVPPLLAADARAVASGPTGEREIAIADLYLGYRTTQLRPEEILTAVVLPLPAARSAATFVKAGRRRALIIAGVNLACALDAGEDGTVLRARIALGSVAPTAVRAHAAERLLEGSPLDDLPIAEAAALVADAIAPISDLRASAEHRTRLAAIHTGRALADLQRTLSGAARG